MDMEEQDRLLTVREVAAIFGVDPKTVRRWKDAGKLAPHRTPGGHLRFSEREVKALTGIGRGGDDG